jgi:hypothetical protein
VSRGSGRIQVPDGIRLDAVEFDACWELLGLGDRPAALALPSPGRTHTERRALLAAVLDRLAARGLADGRRPHRHLAELFGLLARPRHEIELHLSGGRTGLAAIAGQRGVVVTRGGDDMRIVGVRAAEALPRLVGMVGPITPAAVRPVNIPAPALDRALRTAGDVWAVADELAAHRVPKADASALARAFERVHELGQFSVTGTVEGRRYRGPWAVGVHRADSGWVGSVRSGRPAATLSVFPVTADRLTARLADLVQRTR